MQHPKYDRREKIKPVIFGVEGLSATKEEVELFSEHNPLGFILFARNIESPEQVKKLTMQLKACLFPRNDILILIDQEGGRVARLRPPHWREMSPAKEFGDMILLETMNRTKKAVFTDSRRCAYDLMKCGINVNCAPLIDLHYEGAHDIIGDRAYSSDPFEVSELAEASCKGFLMGNVFPVIKHIPGHGRANCDSHLELPVVDTKLEELRETDFIPFKKLAHMPFAMTAHIKYTDIDAENCATQSPKVIEIIRNEIGFKGLILSDDVSMKALDGDMKSRCAKILQAGCDVILHCNGDYKEMDIIANNTDFFSPEDRERYRNCWKALRS